VLRSAAVIDAMRGLQQATLLLLMLLPMLARRP